MWNKHRDDLQWRRVRLGMVPTQEMARMYSVVLRWADAIYIHEGKVHIVEAKLKVSPGAIGQLEHYAELFRRTPEFSQYHSLPIQLVLLTPHLDMEMVELCSRKGIAYVHWIPEGYEYIDGKLLEKQ